MSIEKTMVCDNCSVIIASDSTIALVKKVGWNECGAKRIRNQDYCSDCLSRGYPKASWYCHPCATEVYDLRCSTCGKTKRERR